MAKLLLWRCQILAKTLCRVFLQVEGLSSIRSNIDQEDTMNEPLAASIIRQLTAEVATSALPDAPVRSEPISRRRLVAPHLRRRSARLLVGLAGRLDPTTQAAT